MAAAAKLYVIPGSHPSLTGRLMLEHKGIPYRRVDLIPAFHKLLLRALRFPGSTVPALVIDGRRVQCTRNISRALDELRPEPPLFPTDPAARQVVEEAERWGDEVVQPIPRRLGWWCMTRDHSSAASFLGDARLGVPRGVVLRTIGPVAWAAVRQNAATDENVRADLAALPGLLDRVDAYVEEGVLGGEQLNAADFQLATSLRLLMCFEDLAPALEGRPAGTLATRVVPEPPGHVGPLLAASWLEPLRVAA